MAPVAHDHGRAAGLDAMTAAPPHTLLRPCPAVEKHR